MNKKVLGPLLGLLCVVSLIGLTAQAEDGAAISDAASKRLAQLEGEANEAYMAWPTTVILDAERRIHYRGHDGNAATEIAKKLVAELEAKQN
jgi:hypothetical protein